MIEFPKPSDKPLWDIYAFPMEEAERKGAWFPEGKQQKAVKKLLEDIRHYLVDDLGRALEMPDCTFTKNDLFDSVRKTEKELYGSP